jgi:predicted ATPase
VVELLKTLFVRGWLAVDPASGEWITPEGKSADLRASELFPSVNGAIAERVAALPDEQHALLLTIATSGSGCHTSLLSYVHGISRLRAAHICDALVERHLVAEANGTFVCAHTLIANVVLDSMSASRRREVHRMIALALTDAAESMRRTADPGTIARHADAGGEREMAHRFALIASDACVARSAWDDALTWLDLASSCSETAEELQAADAATAALLGRAGWSSPPERRSGFRSSGLHIGRDDVDLMPDVQKAG